MEMVKAINTTSRALNLSVGVAQPGDVMDIPLPEVQVWCDYLVPAPADVLVKHRQGTVNKAPVDANPAPAEPVPELTKPDPVKKEK